MAIRRMLHLRQFPTVAVLPTLLLLALALAPLQCQAAAAPATTTPPAAAPASALGEAGSSLMQIGPGDTITVQVFGQPDMSGAVYVAEDGSVSLPLAGSVQVATLSPGDAARRIEEALRKANVLVDPHVTIAVTQSRNQRVSVLGEVGNPGRYTVDSGTSPLDLLAQAGGVKESGADTAFILRRREDGKVQRLPVHLAALVESGLSADLPTLQAGDVLLVPPAEQYFVSGEVTAPARYRYHENLTVAEAIARAGGLSARGSDSRVEIRRHMPDGKVKNIHVKTSDSIQPDDIVQVKERLF
jgi:polysaccharide export outer membrane protein